MRKNWSILDPCLILTSFGAKHWLIDISLTCYATYFWSFFLISLFRSFDILFMGNCLVSFHAVILKALSMFWTQAIIAVSIRDMWVFETWFEAGVLLLCFFFFFSLLGLLDYWWPDRIHSIPISLTNHPSPRVFVPDLARKRCEKWTDERLGCVWLCLSCWNGFRFYIVRYSSRFSYVFNHWLAMMHSIIICTLI